MILTILGYIIGGMVVFWLGKRILPFLWDIVSFVMGILILPIALLGGCLGFILEVGLAVLFIWICNLILN